MNYFETLVSLSKIVDECEKKLESNATTKKKIRQYNKTTKFNNIRKS